MDTVPAENLTEEVKTRVTAPEAEAIDAYIAQENQKPFNDLNRASLLRTALQEFFKRHQVNGAKRRKRAGRSFSAP